MCTIAHSSPRYPLTKYLTSPTYSSCGKHHLAFPRFISKTLS